MLITSRCTSLVGAALAGAVVLGACGTSHDVAGGQTGSRLRGTVRIDGSSTVAPLSEAAAESFRQTQPGVQVTVGTSGTGGGFEKFCNGETDISDASRPIKDSEKKLCEAKGVTYEEFPVANDALTVVVNKSNTWVRCLTVAQLKKIWEPGSTVSRWNQVDPAFPNEPLKLFGAGTDSGTFDYFTEAVNGKSGASRTDYQATEDDNVTIRGVQGVKGGLGYFGFSYFEEVQDKLKAVDIDGGNGCVAPSVQAVQDKTYAPLGRPLFIYAKADSLKRPEVGAFVEFYVSNTDKITEEAMFVPLTQAQKDDLRARLEKLKAGG